MEKFMFGLSEKDLKWNKLWDLWVEDKIESPFNELMKYYSEINNGGHLQFFDNVSDNYNLDEFVKNIIAILPEFLRENLETAYKIYLINPDDISDENNFILECCDSFYYDNEEFVAEILKLRADIIEL